jgi:flagellar basal body-associated protein FliL
MYETDPRRRRGGLRWVFTIVAILLIAIVVWIVLAY